MGLFLFASRTVKMALTYRRKIHKEGNATPDELEQNVAQALYDLEQGDLKQDLKYLHIVAVKEVTVAAGKSALVVVIPFRLAANFRKIHTRQKRPNSRTLTSVHNAILDDLVYPADITGKRLRYKTDGAKQLKVYLDKKDKSNLEDKIDTFCAVYRKLTGKDTVFTFDN